MTPGLSGDRCYPEKLWTSALLYTILHPLHTRCIVENSKSFGCGTNGFFFSTIDNESKADEAWE